MWLIVRRTIDGVERRCIETLAAFWREGLSIQQYPGLCVLRADLRWRRYHYRNWFGGLRGRDLRVGADGVDLGDATVQDGALVLPNAIEAEVIVYGYRQSSWARTLRLGILDSEGQPAIGKPSLASEATIDVYQTGFLRVGMGGEDGR